MARAHVEDDIQRALVTHLAVRGARGLIYWHTPNGGKRNAREAGRFKAMGVRAGVSDLILVHCGKIYALELKAPGGRPSESQLAFIHEIEAAGAFTCVCEGLDRAIAVLECWGLLVGKAA
jgi:hypothetical protein